MVDYSSAKAKLDRARTHIEELGYLIFRYLRTHPYRVRMEKDFGAEKYGYYISLVRSPPTAIPAIVGDAAHNLRAVLDHLISACAVANGRTPKGTAFPTATDRLDLESRIKRYVAKAGEEAMQIVRDLRPYLGGVDALVHLHRLDVMDKHQAIVAVAGAGDFRYRHIPRSDRPQILVEEPVYLLGTGEQFVPSREGYEMEPPIELGLSIDVVFPADGPFGNLPCVKALEETAELVSEVVNQFQTRIP
jgi:hypothetical protein